MIVWVYRCRKCGQVYPLVPYHRAAAPHGPNRDCRSQDWERVKETVSAPTNTLPGRE